MRKRIDDLYQQYEDDRDIAFHVIDKQNSDDVIKLERMKQTDNDRVINIVFIT
jgi:hypothetical protein